MSESERAAIAHLFRRAGFGARPAELDYYVDRGYATAVEDLVTARPIAGSGPAPSNDVEFAMARRNGAQKPEDLGRLQTALLSSFVNSTTPLVERMVLFLLDHFATPFRPFEYSGDAELFTLTSLFRTHALGSWSELLHSAIEDVALGCSLDAHLSSKTKPNENLARELLELFSLGSGYGEHDVREAARALTGYRVQKYSGPEGERHRLVFVEDEHDPGVKALFGQRGNFRPRDVINLALSQPAAAAYIARQLAAYFVMPKPSASLVRSVADALVRSNWSLATALRTLFVSGEFRGAEARASLVKTPLEFVAGAMRAVASKSYQFGLEWALAQGQTAYQPPNVGGWPGGEAWLSTGGLLARYNGALILAYDVAYEKNGHARATPRTETVRGWAELFGMTELAPATSRSLERLITTTATQARPERDREALTMVISSPDFSVA